MFESTKSKQSKEFNVASAFDEFLQAFDDFKAANEIRLKQIEGRLAHNVADAAKPEENE